MEDKSQKLPSNEFDILPVVELTRVTREFMRRKHKFFAVNNVSFALNSGDFVAIVGKSGNGKSTLLNLIAGLLKPTHGSVKVCGEEISERTFSDAKMSRLRACDIGFVTQSQTLLQNLTVHDNILLPVQIAASACEVSKSGISKAEVSKSEVSEDLNETRALELCKQLHIEDLLWCYPNELSGGEMRRVMIVRALINNPKLLILDEPTGDLDVEHTRIVVKMLREAAKNGVAVLMVTHDVEAARCADRTYTMDCGLTCRSA
ncbi:ABC transporter ATP-binding protein [Gardnerella swidsinskii]|jgi:ABC-type antimicrobial peptide transporter, ATPase component|uniref:ABC transporter ATP-binding protein n=1 Tax=Gardnerella swidsinskii TaxID=2792979 RepID=A0A9X7FF85_9BIFI|nr:ABC transporter ATP-binding protein [Gardnerella swidsinskii]ADB13451.1 ABC transporter, ATP-binding protein [Gardnerella vaginalis 409-05]APW18397.1 macrolide ABC transporter substrate-binding protein [Gardnerella vaginalis]EFH71620.1 ABC-type antimicrobial peptide transporter, ATPase component [Gardnerella vaginalis 5-1]MDK6295412.1 ABC transporter ATP-binding protein [Gardnerella swidsinskii]MDK7093079.1 ABC transporter ATP-binding protein [Gardnerella swidsinskii]